MAEDKGYVEFKEFGYSLSLGEVFGVKFLKRKLFIRHNKSNTNMSRLIEFMTQEVWLLMILGILLIRVHILNLTWCR